MKSQILLSLSLFISFQLSAQQDLSKVLANTNVALLDSLSQAWSTAQLAAKEAARTKALEKGWPLRRELPDGTTIELRNLDPNGNPVYYTTNNVNAAISTRANQLHSGGSLGLHLNGNGMTLGEWDGGATRITHEQLSSRTVQADGASSLSNHATHVAGTLIGDGTGSGASAANAKGMAPQAQLKAYDWNNDSGEMAAAAANGLLVSNHSYGIIGGYNYDGQSGGVYYWSWYGGSGEFNSSGEDPYFGMYDQYARDWDLVAFNAPYYLIVKSAGNDRNNNPGSSHQIKDYFGGSGYITYNAAVHPAGDGIVNGGYDLLSNNSNAKNILVVASAGDCLNYTGPGSVAMSSYSSWGPTDDGRIKPDISGNGEGLYSSLGGNDADYGTYSGTSMASPNVAGSAILLQEHYEDTHGAGNFMRAATLKGLIIHTADETGDHPGPDYRFGWGLMNSERAAQVISQDAENMLTIQEEVLANNSSFSMTIQSDGLQSLTLTLSWTDPAGPATTGSTVDNPAIKLVNDLDLRLSNGSTVYSPYILDPANPAAAATTGDNFRDNIEKIYLGTVPAGTYTLTVSHKGTLSGGSQAFSLIVTGGEPDEGIIENPSACQLNLSVPDNSCSPLNQFMINVASAPGDQLGTNVYLKEVKLIVQHTWTADLDISLISPSGVAVDLSTDNGHSGDNYGDPASSDCSVYTGFRMSATTAITAATAPFVGIFLPEGSFFDFDDGSNPVGTWTLQLCDDESLDAGMLKFVELVFSPACPATLWYADADGDGYGNPSAAIAYCEKPFGYVDNNADCNDSNAAINPGAAEVCNDLDDDCDGEVDEGLMQTWHPDSDSDGYGSPAGLIFLSCSPIQGYINNALDCDDANAAVYPGATEVCNGMDDDCDGQTDEGLLSAFYADADGDGFGAYFNPVLACSAPPGYVANNGDCDDNNPAIPSYPEICNGLDDDCNGFAEAPLNTWTGNGDGIDWTDPFNWSDVMVPLACQDIVIPAGNIVLIPAGAVVFGRTLYVDAGAELLVSATAVVHIEY
jgi:subtilisin-like proprotein convertase family protein